MESRSEKSSNPSVRGRFDSLRLLLPVAAAAVAVSIVSSCREEKKDVMAADVNPETFPTMKTIDVNTVISDSGITRYSIRTPLWLMFEEATEPYWKFPDSIHFEQYDEQMRVTAFLDCDSAIYYKQKQLWQLDGYVNIRNTAGERFLTSQLLWDQRRQKVYSDSFIHIERQGKIIEGYGFESDERMTDYRVLRVAGIFPASDFRADSAKRAAAMSDTSAAASGAVPVPSGPQGANVPHVVLPSQSSPHQSAGPNPRPVAPGRSSHPDEMSPNSPRARNLKLAPIPQQTLQPSR